MGHAARGRAKFKYLLTCLDAQALLEAYKWKPLAYHFSIFASAVPEGDLYILILEKVLSNLPIPPALITNHSN